MLLILITVYPFNQIYTLLVTMKRLNYNEYFLPLF